MDGDVLVQVRPKSVVGTCLHWAYVSPGTPWRHTTFWKIFNEAPKPDARATKPRRFVSISRTVHIAGHTLDAIADDGTAWWKALGSDDQTEWQQLSPLPARELPTEPEF